MSNINKLINILSTFMLIALVFFGADWFDFHSRHGKELNFFYTQLSFASSHVYFQFLTLSASKEFETVTEKNLRIKNSLLLLIAFFIIFFIIAYTLYISQNQGWKLFIRTWNIWHLTTQTAGIFIAMRISEVVNNDYYKDFRYVKLFFIMLTSFYFLFIFEDAFPIADMFLKNNFILLKKSAFCVMYLFLTFIVYNHYKRGMLRRESSWIFIQMALWPFAFFKPVFMAIFMGGIHGLQYFQISKNVLKNSRLLYLSPTILFFILLISIEFTGIIHHFKPFIPETPDTMRFVLSFGATSGVVHFLYDGLIFKFRNASVRGELLRLIKN